MSPLISKEFGGGDAIFEDLNIKEQDLRRKYLNLTAKKEGLTADLEEEVRSAAGGKYKDKAEAIAQDFVTLGTKALEVEAKKAEKTAPVNLKKTGAPAPDTNDGKPIPAPPPKPIIR